ncbi:cysteine hydrolase [Streptomyces sp. NPDC096311]|uniref:cysteine hydrolase n=1 Tax=Streptomyces sp. NPDC096311 TaxID=3366083 RepID=UPI003810971F
MTLTRIDDKAALIVVDLQKALTATTVPLLHPVAEIVGRASRLAAAFRTRGLPVVLVNATGSAPGRTEVGSHAGSTLPADLTEILPELDPQPSDIRVSKRTWGAFHNTPLDDHLRGLGVTQVVIVGVATSVGVESTARAAHEHGYHVVLATDAMTDGSVEAHDNSIGRIFPRVGETATTEEVLQQVGESPQAL